MSNEIPKTDGNELNRLAGQLTRDRQAVLAADTNEIFKTIVIDTRPKVSEEIFIKYSVKTNASTTSLVCSCRNIQNSEFSNSGSVHGNEYRAHMV